MTVTLGGIAGLVAALAFAFLVLRLAAVLGKAGVILDETAASLRTTSDNVQPTLQGLTETVALANDSLARVDAMTGSVAGVARDASVLSSLVTTTVASPVVKVAAAGYGLRAAVRALAGSSR